MMVMKKNALYSLSLAILSFCASACGQTSVRPLTWSLDTSLSPPSRILVQTFALSAARVTEYQGILRQQPSNNNPLERQREIGSRVAEALTIDLVDGLRHLGFNVERMGRETPVMDNDLVIDGQFLNVDEGSPLRRLLFGFGSGRSTIETRIQAYYGTQRRKLLEFTMYADSGKMPGAAATVPAGAAVHGGVTAGLVAGTALTTGIKAYSSEVARIAESSAEQTVYYLSEFFAKQGWIRPNQAKKARITN